MSLMAKAKFESFREAKLQVYFDVQQSWNELQKVQQSIRISEKNLEILRTLERLSLVKFKAASTGSGTTSNSSGSNRKFGIGSTGFVRNEYNGWR